MKYKMVYVLMAIMIVGLSATNLAEHYSKDDVNASPIVKEMSKKVNGFVQKATHGAFGPDAIGTFISMPGE